MSSNNTSSGNGQTRPQSGNSERNRTESSQAQQRGEGQTRTPRSVESRENTNRKSILDFNKILPDPDPRPGIEHKYVRVEYSDSVDNLNFSAARRSGWEPVQASDYPELMIMSDHRGGDSGIFDGSVVIGGLMLCSRPSEVGDEIREIAASESRRQMEAIDGNYLRDQNPHMKKFSDKKTRVSFSEE